MNVNLTGLSAALLSILLFRFVWSKARTWKTPMKCWIALASLPPTLLALGFTAHYLHVLPEQVWFYELRSWRGSEFLLLFPGLLFGILASAFPRWTLVGWLLLLVGVVVTPFIKPVIAPLAESQLEDRWNEGVCLQSTSSTCGPASVATILKNLGISVTEREVAHAAYSYAGGTEAWYLARFVRSKGLSAHFEFHNGFAPQTSFPAVAGVRVGGGHFISILGKEGDLYHMADPMFGDLRVSELVLKRRYDFTGFYLVISKPSP